MRTEDEFVQIIQNHQGIIFKITTIYTDNKSDQQDLYQDIVYQLWKSFKSFRGDSKISTWMYRIALNTALTKIKKKKRTPYGVPIENVVVQETESNDADFQEKLKVLYQHIHNLNVLEKGIMLLLLEGKKYEEIAVITGLTRSNVGTRIARIKQKLKNRIVKK